MRACSQDFSAGIQDMHELEADRSAVRAPQDRDDLEQARVLKTQNAVDEDLAVEVLVAEAIGSGMQLAVVAALLEAERVEIGVQMATRAISAYHHERADAVARRLTQRLAFGRA